MPPPWPRRWPRRWHGGRHAQEFRQVLARSSFLVNGEQAAARAAESVPLAEGAVIEVLPPFAGG